MSKYEVKAIRHYSAVFLGEKRITQWPVSDEDACKIVDMLNQETTPLLDELATKDAVIDAQTERIKELELTLKRIAYNAPKSRDEIDNSSYPPIHYALDFVYIGKIAQSVLQGESEADNG